MSFTLRKVGGSRFGGELRQSQSHAGRDDSPVCGVWGSEGKIYISTNEGKQLIVTDSVPRSRWAESYATIVENSSSLIVAVFPNPSNPSQVYVIYSNSITDCIEHNPTDNQWVKKHTFQLSNAKGAEILSVSFHPKTSMFFWCEKRGSSVGLASCCVCMREIPESWDVELLSCIGPVIAILHSCPVMSLFIINKGVCMLPCLPDEPKQLLFFWTFVPRSLKVYVWNHCTIGDLDKTDFKSIIMHLLPSWNSFSSLDTKNIISLTTHPTTLELLILDNTFGVSYAYIQDGELCIQKLCLLNLPDHTKHKSVENMFAVSLYVGLVWDSGSIDIFDSKSGAALCSITELTDLKLTIWTYSGTVHGIGVWAKEGIWELKSKSISDVAKVMQNSVKFNSVNLPSKRSCTLDQTCEQPSTSTDAKESKKYSCHASIQCSKCFPGFKLHQTNPICLCSHPNGSFSGPVTATNFLHSWHMFPLAAKIALGSVVSKIIDIDTGDLDVAIETELLDILVGNSFQSPVATLGLLCNHPWCRDQMIVAVKHFLNSFENESEESDKKVIRTTLNASLYPYMKQFISLTEKFDDIVEMEDQSCHDQDFVSDHAEVTEIFQRLNLAKPDCQSLSRLGYLQSGCPREMLQSVGELVGLGVDDTNVTTQEMTMYSQRWRNIFRLEWKDGHWQKNRAAVENSLNPSLGLLCDLVYNEEPDWLLRVHDKGMAVVNAKDSDERAKDHVTQSVLDCLPSLIVHPSPQSTHAHATLLWNAGQEMQAMQVILRHQMWSEALDFFSSLAEDTNSLAVLFIMMFKAFLRYGAPKEVPLKALSLVPQGLCTYEILLLLQDNGPKCDEPFVQDSQTLAVGDVRKYLQEMLK